MGSKIFVGNLSFDTNETGLRAHFEGAGLKVEDVSIVMDRDSGRPRGFGFVQLASDEDAATAMSSLDGQELDGRPLRINEANERPPRRDGGGGGGGGGRY